ncbi:MAG TPA: hypothetical protein VMT55_04375 [Candidatus Sulfotelmatobacter sp.]|nr:hypothetical protein [Candidatus Sulfotelmatobacter sp.]
MKNKLFILIALAFLASGAAFAAGTSAGYKMITEVVDAGSAFSQSSSYKLLGKARGTALDPSGGGSSYLIGAGFLRAAYTGHAALGPIVTVISPATGVNSGKVHATISGANFVGGATVKLSLAGEADIAATNVAVGGSGQLTGDFDIGGAKAGLWDVTVTNPDGRSGTLPKAFRVTYAAPAIISITPNTGYNDEIVNIANLAGTGFISGAAVKLTRVGESDLVGQILSVEATRITCRFDLTGKAVGYWDVVVNNPDGQSATLSLGFVIKERTLKVIGQVTNGPNPFDPTVTNTTIKYVLSQDADIAIYCYSLRGERVWSYQAPAGAQGGKAGQNQVLWDGLTAFRTFAGAGVYIVQVVATVDGKPQVLGQTKVAIIK